MTTPPKITTDPARPFFEAVHFFIRNIPALIGSIIFALILIMTLYGALFYRADPFEIVWLPFVPPFTEAAFPLGTDYLGRDLGAGILSGGATTLAVAMTAAMLTLSIGISFGAIAGYCGGISDDILMRITEFFQVLPALLFAMVLVTVFSPSPVTIAFAIGVVSWPQTARLTRAEFLRIRELDYVTAARAAGSSDLSIMIGVILPNALPPLIVSGSLTVGVAILFEAGLSFLGLGDPNVMTWGQMIGANRNYILESWWPVTLPGMMIFFTVLSISLIGDGLNDALNPKMRER